MSLHEEIEHRRTFAIISHPDAGKTTLTEKFLLYGGAIQTAGAVKSNKIRRGATSDFMEIERQRGISVSTSVMTFDVWRKVINLLDTPGHRDFAEDTYRTLDRRGQRDLGDRLCERVWRRRPKRLMEGVPHAQYPRDRLHQQTRSRRTRSLRPAG
jgi:hypothetical protein